MEEYLVTRKQAEDLKKLGFDRPCLYAYDMYDVFYSDLSESQMYTGFDYNNTRRLTSRPFKVQVFDWFRENYLYHYSIQRSVSVYYGCITLPSVLDLQVFTDVHHNYESVESECIDILIKLAKEKKL